MLYVLKHRKFSMKEKKRKRVREKWLEVIERRKRRPKANQIVEKKNTNTREFSCWSQFNNNFDLAF